jgi:hypothetical protein
MSLNFRIRLNENNLSFILNQWLHLNPEDLITIEIDTDKTAEHPNEEESNDETNET